MTTHIVNTHEAKSRLSELIREALEGAEVIVARNGQPVVKIVPWHPTRPVREPGAWAGLIDYHGHDVVGSDDDVVSMFDQSSDGYHQ